MEKVLVIDDYYIICEILVKEYLQYYLSNKKVSLGEYFYVMYKEKILMWVYDAKIFRQQQRHERFETDRNDHKFISNNSADQHSHSFRNIDSSSSKSSHPKTT